MQHPLQIGHADAFVHHQPFDLVEHRAVGVVESVGAVHASRSDHAKRRCSLLHHPDLDRRGVGAQEAAVLEVEGVVHRARRVVGGEVEGFEVVVVVLDFRSFDDLEPDALEERLDSFESQGERVQTSRALAPPRQCHVDAARFEPGSDQIGAERFASPLERVAERPPGRVDAPAGFGPLFRGEPPHPLQLVGDQTLPAEIAHPNFVQPFERACTTDLRQCVFEGLSHIMHHTLTNDIERRGRPFPRRGSNTRVPCASDQREGAQGRERDRAGKFV